MRDGYLFRHRRETSSVDVRNPLLRCMHAGLHAVASTAFLHACPSPRNTPGEFEIGYLQSPDQLPHAI
jgi:hypothetical protein